MDNKGNGGILLIIGMVFVIGGIVAGIWTGTQAVNNSVNASQNAENVVPIIGWSIVGYFIAAFLLFIGIVLIVFGIKS